jgi:hypothetical protein
VDPVKIRAYVQALFYPQKATPSTSPSPTVFNTSSPTPTPTPTHNANTANGVPVQGGNIPCVN